MNADSYPCFSVKIRVQRFCAMEFRYQFGDETVTVQVEKSGDGYTVTVGEQRFTVSAARLSQPGELWLTLNGVRRLAFTASDGPRRWVAFDSQPFVLIVPQTGRDRKSVV